MLLRTLRIKKPWLAFPSQIFVHRCISNVSEAALVAPLLRVALVGRPNTGKSTLFNRLTGTKLAIVSPVPGTTRDRREGTGYLAGLPIHVTDTGGLDDRGEVASAVQYQVSKAVNDADVVLFMLDSRAGVTVLDRHFATWLRKTIGDSATNSSTIAKKSIFVIANKAEGAHNSDSLLDTSAEALRLGFGESLPLSAAHGDGLADLATVLMQEAQRRGCLEEVVEGPGASRARIARSARAGAKPAAHERLSHNAMPVEERLIQLAIMGRPNVGKSTILNAIVGDERSITGPMAGLTRDSVSDIPCLRPSETCTLKSLPHSRDLPSSNNPLPLSHCRYMSNGNSANDASAWLTLLV